MFEKEIELIKTIFSNYFADGKYFLIFLMAIVLLFIEEKKKENRNLLIYYPSLVLATVANPLFCYFILKFVGENVYYRFLWLLPIGIVIAYLGAEMIAKVGSKVKKIILLGAFIGIIAYSGTYMYTTTIFGKVNNWLKVPDEYLEITQILSNLPIEQKKAVTSTDMVGYIRQIDASIQLAYGRRPYEDYEMYPIVKYYNNGDVESLANLCKQENTNIIIYNHFIPLTMPLAGFGYQLYAQTEHYDIYVLTEALPFDVPVDEETLVIKGLKNSYKLCFVNDLHIIVPDEEVSAENKETVRQRYQEFQAFNGKSSTELWNQFPRQINELNPDYVILGGDILDYVSAANVNILKNGMQKIKSNIMYLRADHDYGTQYNPDLTQEYVNQLEKSVDSNLEVYCQDLGEILLVGIDNSTSQLSSKALATLKEIFARGKPIVLATHVPFNSKVDDSLEKASKVGWQDRNLTWDEAGTAYLADENTQEFLKMLYTENSPVKAVLAGHLHFKNTSQLTENIIQYVWDASFKGKIGILNVVGEG